MVSASWSLIALPLVLGWTSGWIARQGPHSDRMRERVSDLQPPGWVFGVVWPILYLLMGWALFRMAHLPKPVRTKATWTFVFFALQLTLNVAWSPVYAQVDREELSTALIYAVLLTASVTTVGFAQYDTAAGGLMLPYLAWLTFASYLSCDSVVLRARTSGSPSPMAV